MQRFAPLALLLSVSLAHAAEPAPSPPSPPRGIAAFGGLAAGLGLSAPEKTLILYGGSEEPEHTPAGIRQHRLNVSTPIYRGKADTWALNLGAGILHFDRPVTLIDGDQTLNVPDDFYRTELGLQYAHHIDSERQWGVRVASGYANDQPFNGSRDTTYNLTGTYSYPGSQNSYWVLMVIASNNSSILPNYVPIPGFLYLYKTPTFSGMFGIPVASIQWRPWDLPLGLAASIFGTNVNAEIQYGSPAGTQVFTGFNFSQVSYMRAAREDVKDRLFLAEKKIFVGVRSPFFFPFGGELQIGQAYDRSLHEGQSALRADGPRTDLGRSWFAGWNFRLIF